MPEHVLKVGNVEITSMLDASASAPCDRDLPDDREGAVGAVRRVPDGRRPHARRSRSRRFVVRCGGKTILIDTGIGREGPAVLPERPAARRARRGRACSPTTSISSLATHMHVDHVGWHTTKQGDGVRADVPARRSTSSPGGVGLLDAARRRERARATRTFVDCVLPLEGDGRTSSSSTSEHRVTDEITLLPTPGHTPAHSSFVISSGGESGRHPGRRLPPPGAGDRALVAASSTWIRRRPPETRDGADGPDRGRGAAARRRPLPVPGLRPRRARSTATRLLAGRLRSLAG